uniref:Uncharacterized protein n=1 Tax=Anguilla anguilla TaxID=7936 RepID=A0A0E9QB73_ANGAN
MPNGSRSVRYQRPAQAENVSCRLLSLVLQSRA